MKNQNREILSAIRKLAERDIVCETFLKAAEVDVRMEMAGQKVTQDFIDETIASRSLKSLIINIMSLQVSRIEALTSELAVAKAIS